jgi:hypothetical protein
VAADQNGAREQLAVANQKAERHARSERVAGDAHSSTPGRSHDRRQSIDLVLESPNAGRAGTAVVTGERGREDGAAAFGLNEARPAAFAAGEAVQ